MFYIADNTAPLHRKHRAQREELMATGRVGVGKGKKKKESSSNGIVDICRREVGVLSPRSFALRSAASEDLILRLGIQRKLNWHKGCVNTVSFNADGNILLSGSDDRMLVLWDWEFGKVKTSFHTGHTDNIFHARFMPYTNDRTIVSCGADGEVRHTQMLESGKVSTALLAEHEGRTHKLAIEPGSPHIFYSCGEDGLVQHFDLRTQSATKIIMCKSFEKKTVYRPIVRLHAITIDPRNPNLIAIAGSEEYARLYDVRKYKCGRSSGFDRPTDCFCPSHLIGDESLGITGLAFSGQSELLASYSDESIYLFSKDLGLGPSPAISSDIGSPSSDMDMSSVPQVYKGHCNMDTVKGVGFFGPNYKYVVSGSDCGRVFIWRKKDGKLLRVMEGDKHVVNCIEPHPYVTTFASSGIENDIKIWTPNAKERAPPVNMDELRKPRSRASFCRFAFPDDLVERLLEPRRQNSSQQGNWEDLERTADLFEQLMNSLSSEDSGEPGTSESPGDCGVS